MEYTESDLPMNLGDGEYLMLEDGSSIRFESNGEAKDVFFGASFERDVELFPDCEYVYEHAGKQFKLTAMMDNYLHIEKI